MNLIPLPWKIAGVAILLLVLGGIGLGLYVKGRTDGREAAEAAAKAAVIEAQQKAAALSDELIIAQAAAMAVTEKKVVSYVDRIRTVQAPDTACPADPRMRLGNYGVRDLLGGGGPPAVGQPPAAVR